MADITMPKMGFDMTEGTIVRWLKKPGDQVKRGEEIAEIETDKVTIAIEAFASGTISEIVVQEGQTAAVGAPIARLSGDGAEPQAQPKDTETATAAVGAGEGGESRPVAQEAGTGGVAKVTEQKPDASAMGSAAGTAREARPSERPGAAADQGASAPTAEKREAAPGNGVAQEVKASPLARRMAEEAGVDLREISGSGPGGRIVRDDISAYVSSRGQPAAAPAPAAQPAPAEQPAQPAPAPAPRAQPTPGAGQVVQLSNMRRTISRRMTQSWQQVPHFFVTTDVDMGAALALRKQINEGQPKEAQVSVNDLIVKASALALLAFPNINASYTDAGIEHHPQVHISIAVALDEGLIAPVVSNCQDRSLGSIGRESKRLVGLAREGKLGADNVQGGTFTVSNLGMYGISDFIAIITPPQAAVLAIGGVQRVPVFKDDSDEVVAKQIMKITISADHRVTDGAEAARFVGEVKRLLESPMQLLVG